MNIEERTYEIIEMYLEGKLRGAELREFKMRLRDDEEFAEEVDAMRDIFKMVEMAGEPDLWDKLERIEYRKQIRQSKQFKVSPRFMYVLYSVMVSILVIAAFAAVSLLIGPSSSSLFNKNFEVYPLTRGYANPAWNKFATKYENRNYDLALVEIEALRIHEDAPKHVVHFYKGMLYLSQYEPHSRMAIDQFDLVMQTSNPFADEARWYKALALLEAGEREAAKEVLEVIVNDSESYNHEVAIRLLDQL